MWDYVSQFGMVIFGLPAIFLVAKRNKWGFVLGLLSQPFFFITSYVNHQWGMFFLSFLYTINWCFGIYEWFYKPQQQSETK